MQSVSRIQQSLSFAYSNFENTQALIYKIWYGENIASLVGNNLTSLYL